jgi:S-DNA-T family DNA segregation ATPase FtsK/SpoIIIE
MGIKKTTRRIEAHYASHGLPIKITKCETVGGGERYILSVKLKQGARESLFFDRAGDIKTSLRIPLFQPFKEDMYLRLAVSDRPIVENSLRKMLTSMTFRRSKMRIPLALGYDIRGQMHFADLSRFPHALYGGATQSGKTVALRCMILSIIVGNTVDKVNLIIIDTGASDLDLFNGIPHLVRPVVKEIDEAIETLTVLVAEMERRIALSIEDIRTLPAIICVVDEYISLVTNAINAEDKKTLTTALANLVRRGRHAKIHIVLATQESAKQDMQISLNNINARMAFTCSNYHNSISILGESGAEKLPGGGAMLFKSPDCLKPMYLQGACMAPEDIQRVVASIASKEHSPVNKFIFPNNMPSLAYDMAAEEITAKPDVSKAQQELAQVIFWALGKDSVSMIQLKKLFPMGNRAADVMDELSRLNIVTEKFAKQPRKVLPQLLEDLSEDTLALLDKYGHPSERIQEILEQKAIADLKRQ